MSLAPMTSAPLKARLERREPLLGLDRAGLGERLGQLGVPERQSRMRVGQLWNWLYVRGATDFAAMTNIAKEFRGELAEHFTLRASRDRHRAGFRRRHAKMAAPSR